MPQQWKLVFNLPYMQLDIARAFAEFSCELSLRPIDANSSLGELTFEIEGATIDEERAKAFGMEWLLTNLMDSYLLAFGKILKPEFREITLLNASELVSIPRTGHAEVTITLAVRGTLLVEDVEKAFDLRRRLVAH